QPDGQEHHSSDTCHDRFPPKLACTDQDVRDEPALPGSMDCVASVTCDALSQTCGERVTPVVAGTHACDTACIDVARPDLDAELHRLYGFDGLRPGQREAVEGTIAGRDVLAIMPTGSGKSLCYQLPALLGDGVTLVVSPLIALMQDQSAALRAGGHDGVEMIASIMSGEAVRAALARISTGSARLVYVAPERFSSRRFLDAIGSADVSRLAIDEAHCLSEWGHDFRPDYLRLADVRTRLGSPPTIAL